MRDYVIGILEKYIDLGNYKFSGDSNIQVRCPFHKGGQESKPSFSINVDEGLFQCFTCKVSGNLKKLLKLLGLPDAQIDQETSFLAPILEENRRRYELEKRLEWIRNNPLQANFVLPEAYLAPWNFMPTKLYEAGFRPDVLQYMEVGFDVRNQRITYPVRDIYGNLAGVVGGATVAGQMPKYKVYEGKRRSGDGHIILSDFGPWFDEDRRFKNYEFKNHHFLWGFDRVYPRLFFGKEVGTLVVVEGFKACLWLIQCGFPNTIALMGSRMSHKQKQQLLRLRANIILFLDNDAPGQEGTELVGSELNKDRSGVMVARYPAGADDCQPDDLPMEGVYTAVMSAMTYPEFMIQRSKRHES